MVLVAHPEMKNILFYLIQLTTYVITICIVKIICSSFQDEPPKPSRVSGWGEDNPRKR
jgi:hypothetical protein